MSYVTINLTAASPGFLLEGSTASDNRLRVSAVTDKTSGARVGDDLVAVGGYSAADFSGGAPAVLTAIMNAKRPLTLLFWRSDTQSEEKTASEVSRPKSSAQTRKERVESAGFESRRRSGRGGGVAVAALGGMLPPPPHSENVRAVGGYLQRDCCCGGGLFTSLTVDASQRVVTRYASSAGCCGGARSSANVTEATSLSMLRSAAFKARVSWTSAACIFLVIFAVCAIIGSITLACLGGHYDASLLVLIIVSYSFAFLALLGAGVSLLLPCTSAVGALFLDTPGDVALFDSQSASRGRLPADTLQDAWANLLWGWALARGRQLIYAAPAPASSRFYDGSNPSAEQASAQLLRSGVAEGADVTGMGSGSLLHLHACGLAEFITKTDASSCCCCCKKEADEIRVAAWASELRWLRMGGRRGNWTMTVGLPDSVGAHTMPCGDLITSATVSGRTHLPPQLAALGRSWLGRPPRAGAVGFGGVAGTTASFTATNEGGARQTITVDADWTTIETAGESCCCKPRDRTTFRTADVPFVYLQRAAVEAGCATWTLFWLVSTLISVAIVAALSPSLGPTLVLIIICSLAGALPVLSVLRLISFTAVGTLCCRRFVVVVGSPGAASSAHEVDGGSCASCRGCCGGRSLADVRASPIVFSVRGNTECENSAATFVARAVLAIRNANNTVDEPPLPVADEGLVVYTEDFGGDSGSRSLVSGGSSMAVPVPSPLRERGRVSAGGGSRMYDVDTDPDNELGRSNAPDLRPQAASSHFQHSTRNDPFGRP